MLTSLQKIGAAVLADRSDLDGLVWPPDKFKTKKGKAPAYVELVLDLEQYGRSLEAGLHSSDAAGAALSVGHIASEVDADWLWARGGVRMTGGPNTASHYPGVRAQNTKNLHKSLFGKEGGEPEILKWMGGAAPPDFVELITRLRPFEAAVGGLLGAPDFKDTALRNLAGVQGNDQVVFVYVSVRLPGDPAQVPLATVLGGSFGKTYRSIVGTAGEPSGGTAYCHFHGATADAVAEPAFAGRYNINKIFVTETSNYASQFSSDNYAQGYRLGAQTVAELDAASEELLNKHRLSIGGVPHVVIPNIVGGELTQTQLTDLTEVTDLVFGYAGMRRLSEALAQATRDRMPYSIDFVAYDSNGNFFKVINWIHEVPRFHLDHVTTVLAEASKALADQLPPGLFFNLYRAYQAIPVISDGSARNEARELLAAVLEQRPIAEETLFGHFRELVQCHRFGRYRKYPNVYAPKGGDDAQVTERGYANAVADYAVLRLALHHLDLLNPHSMHDHDAADFFASVPPEVAEHFRRLHFSPRQQGIFFLGRALSQMAYEQHRRGNSKRIYQKINFNGMDFRSLRRLSADLAESGLAYKAREGGNDTVYDKLSWNLDRFNRVVAGEEEAWLADSEELGKAVKPDAALYFLLAGANFKGKRKPKPEDDIEAAAPAEATVE